MPGFPRTLTVCILSAATLFCSGRTFSQQPVEPLLRTYCLGCHNDSESEAGFSLQTPESLKKGSENGPVLNASDPMAAVLYRVLLPGSEITMPPDGEPQPSQAERAALQNWVLSGARMQAIAVGDPQVPRIQPFQSAVSALLAGCRLNDNRVALGGANQVACRDLSSDAAVWKVPLENQRVAALEYLARSERIVAAVGTPGVSGGALLLSSQDGRIIGRFQGHTDAAYAVAVTADERILATAGYDRRILLHDVKTGNVLRTLQGHNGSVFGLCFDPAGKVLCSASGDGTVKVWHVETGTRLDTLSQPTAEQYVVRVSPNGEFVYAAGADNRVRVWRLESRQRPAINPILISRFAHEQPITCLELSADGRLLATAAEDGSVRIWQTNPLRHLQTLPELPQPATSLTFLEDGRLLLTQHDGSYRIVKVTRPESDIPSKEEKASRTAETQPTTVTVRLSGPVHKVAESEHNDWPANAQQIDLPALVNGVINPADGRERDADCFRFHAEQGQQLLLEINAQRIKAPLDSRVEVLDSEGKPVLRTMLQAVRDSYFTFRGKDSNTSDDFRVFNWQEMELNEFLYSDGEVVRLWHYPRGPDSGFMVYPGFGNRVTWFDTTPAAHALQAPCFIVVPHAPGEELIPNGLPSFPIYYENDDDSQRELGSDSRLFFTAPQDGDFIARVTDARDFGGPEHRYELTVRSPVPNFSVSVNRSKLKVHRGTGQELIFTARRIDGYRGPIKIDAEGLPEGFSFSGPLTIQQDQLRAMGTIFAAADAEPPTADQVRKISLTASAPGFDKRPIGTIEELALVDKPKLLVRIHHVSGQGPKNSDGSAQVLEIRPGQTVRAVVQVQREGQNGVVSFGKADAGRNLPHGVFVDNIGLNGLLLLAGQNEREFFITASPIAEPMTAQFFLKSNVDGITSQPVTLKVLPKSRAGSQQDVTKR